MTLIMYTDGTVELRHKQFFISPKYNMEANFYISTFFKKKTVCK